MITYESFKLEAIGFAKSEDIDLSKYDPSFRNRLHIHMYKYISKFSDNTKENLKICNSYENRFWKDIID